MGMSVVFKRKWLSLLRKRSYRVTVFGLLLLTLLLNVKVMSSSGSFKKQMLLCNALMVLVITSYTDLKDRVVPNIYVIYLVCSWIIVTLLIGEISEVGAGLLFLLAYIPVALLVFFLAKGGVGMGDVKLLGAMSLYFDEFMFVQVLLLMSLFIFLLAVITLILRHMRKAWAKDVDSFPLVPFLFVSSVFIVNF
ncbi:A24 family peptidase [Fastidiosipila sanguinis]|uniref:Prepilin type IV endopeptidase peptidase domain-containing protein n=1 Tax=Fastidiosipila sanguinis TaxID=236753 RepID=A0A2S0KPV4_9FIRM|nr:prepilin peptidase [Fastidiosipila sanguinis]AVM43062.1 hypothetical protein C5Q98_07495 [Fastidiosipila sanguinis]